jgi:hypothetical protein
VLGLQRGREGQFPFVFDDPGTQVPNVTERRRAVV